MEIKAYLLILIRKWWLVIPAFLITFTTTAVLTSMTQPIYQSTASFVVTPTSDFEDIRSFVSGLNILSTRSEIATTYTEVAKSRYIKVLAMEALGLSPEEWGGSLSANSRLRAGTNVLEITAQGPEPELTRDFANSVGNETMDYVKQLYETFEVKPLDQAGTPSSPIKPNRALNLILGATLGVILGVGLAFLAEYLQAPATSATHFDILDDQTGVYNKYYFLQRLGEEIVRAKRNRYGLSLALIRVDNLKLLKGINANKVRVEILRQVALIASQHLREEDIVAHLGEETFGILLPDITGENAKSIMEYLQTRIAWTPFESTITKTKFNLKTTVGVATYDHNGASRDELVAKANHALQLAEVDQDGKAYLVTDIS